MESRKSEVAVGVLFVVIILSLVSGVIYPATGETWRDVFTCRVTSNKN